MLRDTYFECNSIECNAVECNSTEFSYKMNDIIDKFLLAGDKYIPEMHLR